MKVSRITIDVDTIVGTIENCKQIMNLSSLPQGMVSTVTDRIPTLDAKIKSVDLYPNVVETSNGTVAIVKFKGIDKKRPMIFIIDDDDNNADAKIRNISKINKYVCIGIIEIKTQKATRLGTTDKNGKIIRVGNHNHTKEIFKMLSLTQFSAAKASSISYVTIISTKDDRAGSIAGLTYAATINKVKFEVERANVTYNECWMCTKRKYELKDLIMAKTDVDSPLKTDDRYWNYKTGYGDMMKTSEGVRKIEMNKPNSSKKENWFEKLMKFFINIIKDIVEKVSNMFWKRKKD